jgi:hypothetical protein
LHHILGAHKIGAGTLGGGLLSPLQITRTRTVLPVPLGSTTAPRTCWSAWRESTPSRTWISTVSSNFALPV